MKVPLLYAFFGLALSSLALAADQGATCRLNAFQLKQPIGIEPEGGTFHPVIEADADSGSYSFSPGSRQQANGTIAIFATDAGGLRNELPLGRFVVSGLASGSDNVRLDLTRKGNLLTISAVDTASKDRPLTITRLGKKESLQAALPPPKKTAGPAAIAAIEGKDLKTTLGVRSGSGTLRPFLRAGAPPGTSVTLNMAPAVPGQTNADVTVYAGENQYLENDRLYARYLISGLNPKGGSHFALHFTVNTKGALEVPEVTDTVTKQPLQVIRYSASRALKMKHAAEAEASSTQ